MSLSSAVRLPLLALFVASPVLFAAEGDLSGVSRPQDATVIDVRPAVEQERIYPLGALSKVSNRLRMEGQISARGQLSSVTYELPTTVKIVDAFEKARKELQGQGAQILFWCVARDCGDSSYWATDLFGSDKLYGLSDQQAFLLLRRAAPQHDTLVALYGVTRGTKKDYLYAEQLASDAPLGELLPTPATVMRELRSTHSLDYPLLTGEPLPAWVALLARSLNQDSTLRFSLSGEHAEAWRQALIGAGVRAARLETGGQSTVGLHIELIG